MADGGGHYVSVRDWILNRWQAGDSTAEIAGALDLTTNAVRNVVIRARKRGDARAVHRYPGQREKWPAEQIAQLKALWASGKTAAEIAKIMGLVSRSAVLGKLHRIKREAALPPRPIVPKATKRGTVFRRPPRLGGTRPIGHRYGPPQIKLPTFPIPDVVAPPDCKPVKLIKRKPSMCSWIIGEPAADKTLCCGAKVARGSWCQFHWGKGHSDVVLFGQRLPKEVPFDG